jgi:hypothetical protein
MAAYYNGYIYWLPYLPMIIAREGLPYLPNIMGR